MFFLLFMACWANPSGDIFCEQKGSYPLQPSMTACRELAEKEEHILRSTHKLTITVGKWCDMVT
jgi:hypothetical protein